MAITKGNITHVLAHHELDVSQQRAIDTVRLSTEDYITVILDSVPDCADREHAIEHARLSMNKSITAIALQGLV